MITPPSTHPRDPARRHLLLLLALGFSLPATACRTAPYLEPSDHARVLAEQTLEGPNPGDPGPLPVETFYYGRGDDKRRPEYRDSVLLTTPSVDGSALVDLGSSAKSRKRYWGFGPDSLPLNGRVWYPAEGEGPFPLVLVAHGNHDMKDFSDPGYDYLGEHLASRGYILASLDMNFLNGAIGGENDARGWLFLKHIEAWQAFNGAEESPVAGRIDLENIALIGHSRGGEAVAVAAALNRLPRYPDDATVTFDFNFPIRSIVAIAPVDGQYRPADQGTPVRDVSYLVFHGSHDGDVTSFHGLRQWQRVAFSPDFDGFKAAVHVYRANHGQWNTVWGASDTGGRRANRILDLDALLDPEDQRTFARVYVSAFLDATLKGDRSALPLFADHRVAGEWLPPTMYVTRYQDASFRTLADFEEDVDVTTGSVPGVRIRGDSLSTWREGELVLRSRNRSNTSNRQEAQGAWLGWAPPEGDSVADPAPARFTLTLDPSPVEAWGLTAHHTLDLALAPTKGADGAKAEDEARDRGWTPADGPVVEVWVEFRDAGGRSARVALKEYGPLRLPLEAWILRRRGVERDRFTTQWDLIPQSFVIPLEDVLAAEPGLDLGSLREISLVFPRDGEGEVVLDQIGISRPPGPARGGRL